MRGRGRTLSLRLYDLLTLVMATCFSRVILVRGELHRPISQLGVQGSKEAGGHPGKYSSTQLRRLCPGDVRASGGSILLVPMIALCTVDLEECVRGVD